MGKVSVLASMWSSITFTTSVLIQYGYDVYIYIRFLEHQNRIIFLGLEETSVNTEISMYQKHLRRRTQQLLFLSGLVPTDQQQR